MFKLRMSVPCITKAGKNSIRVPLIELAIDTLPQRGGGGDFVDYDFLNLQFTCISHKMKWASPLRLAALTCKQYNRNRS